MKNDQTVPFKACHFQYYNRIFFSRKLRNMDGRKPAKVY